MISAGTKPRKTGKRMKTSKSIFISKKGLLFTKIY